jgi:hypothetical protein
MSSEQKDSSRGLPDDGVNHHVVDPEDYNRTQRFKEIHEARQRVSEFVTQMEMPEGGDSYYPREATRLAYLVALYILELEPLIVQSDFGKGDLVPEGSKYGSLRKFAATMGYQRHSEDGTKPPSPVNVMQIFSAANRFYAQVGMDLELQADHENEAGADYSDILDGDPP